MITEEYTVQVGFLFVWFLFIFWQPFDVNYDQPWYMDAKKKSTYPSDGVIAIVWTILFSLMTVGIWLYWRNLGADETYYVIIFSLFALLNFILKFWTTLLFKYKRFNLCNILIILIIIINTIIIVLFGLERNWTSMTFFIPLNLWSIYALYLTSKLKSFYSTYKNNNGKSSNK